VSTDLEAAQQAKDTLLGGRTVTVDLKKGGTEDVFVREATVREVIDDTYFNLLREDPMKLVAFMCGKPPAWLESISRASWAKLRQTEEDLNFDFALGEMKAALARGQKMKVIDDEADRQARRVLALLSVMPSQSAPKQLPDLSRPLEPAEAMRLRKQLAGSSSGQK
jgi:hypothetical protein